MTGRSKRSTVPWICQYGVHLLHEFRTVQWRWGVGSLSGAPILCGHGGFWFLPNFSSFPSVCGTEDTSPYFKGGQLNKICFMFCRVFGWVPIKPLPSALSPFPEPITQNSANKQKSIKHRGSFTVALGKKQFLLFRSVFGQLLMGHVTKHSDTCGDTFSPERHWVAVTMHSQVTSGSGFLRQLGA